MLIEWENTETLLLKVTDFSISDDLFKKGVHVCLDFFIDSVNNKTTKYIERWRNKNEIKTIIINKDSDYYLLGKGYPKMFYINNNSNTLITSGEFYFNEYKNISRKYKISKILNN